MTVGLFPKKIPETGPYFSAKYFMLCTKLPFTPMNGRLPRIGSLGGPGGNLFGFLVLKKSQYTVKVKNMM